jgi:hypothetical protein
MTITRHPALPGKTWNRRVIVRPLAVRRAAQGRWRAWAARQAEAGRTTRGATPRRRIEHRLLLAEIDALAAAINGVYAELPASAMVKCIQLSSQLAAIRRKLT